MKKKQVPKNKKLPAKKETKKPFFKVIIILVPLCLLALAALVFFRNSPYFRIADIEITGGASGAVRSAEGLSRIYKGRNIFEVDIRALAARLKTENPFIKYAVVRRVLPNTLAIDLIERNPVALVKARREFPVDADGMVLPQDAIVENLIVIDGVRSWTTPQAGTKMKDRGLRVALDLIRLCKEKSIDVYSVDVNDSRNAVLGLDNGVEVKIGSDKFDSRLNMLKSTLKKKGLDFGNIRYIDLRFKDVVIKPR